MAFQCRLLEHEPKPGEAKPGDMWFCPWYLENIDAESLKTILSPQYISETMAKRAPICVALPGGAQWIVDGLPYDEQFNPKIDSGWKVSGEAPNLTASPSIKTSSYHGYLRDGVLTDDLDGRRY